MVVEIAFFDVDELLCRGEIRIAEVESSKTISGARHAFDLTYSFEDPACPISIVCRSDSDVLYKAALRMGVHDSDDWESLDLGNIHTMAFFCRLDAASAV